MVKTCMCITMTIFEGDAGIQFFLEEEEDLFTKNKNVHK